MRMYLSTDQFARRALGRFWSSRMRGLNYPLNGEGNVIAEAIMDASVEADDHVRRRLMQPGSTTVSANSTGTELNVASTTNFDTGTGDDSYVQINGAGALYKIVDVEVADWNKPYPGVITVSPTIVGTITAGSTVVGVIKERTNVTGVSTNFADGTGMETQEAQTAVGHSPKDLGSDLVRAVWLTSPPISAILSVSIVLRWAGNATPISINNLAVNSDQGWFRMPIGQYVPQGSDVEVFYIGGYQQISRSMQNAVAILAADNLATGLAPVAAGYSMAEVGGSRVSTTVKSRRGRLIDDEVTTLRSMALQKLDPHIRMTP